MQQVHENTHRRGAQRRGRCRTRPSFERGQESIATWEGLKIGGIGNVVVDTVVRMFTRKAVGRAMKSAKSASGKRKKDGPKKGSAKGKKGAL
jgi:hypothetical protein